MTHPPRKPSTASGPPGGKAADKPAASARPSLTLDVALYEHLLEESGLSEEEKHEFLEALWEIVVAFVELGFGVHPLQQADDGCGQNAENSGTEIRDLLSSWDSAKTDDNPNLAGQSALGDAERKET